MPHGDPYGSGIRLDKDWDLVVDNAGDIDEMTGFDELHKDLAFRVTNRVTDEFSGLALDNRKREKIRVAVAQEVLDDERVVELTSPVKVEQDNDNADQINISIEGRAGSGPFDFVIPVQH